MTWTRNDVNNILMIQITVKTSINKGQYRILTKYESENEHIIDRYCVQNVQIYRVTEDSAR